MKNIFYLIGAGASFGKRNDGEIIEGLPIVDEFPMQIVKMIEKIKSGNTELESQHKAKENQIHALIENLNWLKIASENHKTIDTFAKKLFLTKNTVDYKRLKIALSAYLTLEQLFKKPDSRYDAFIASLLNSTIDDFPNNVSILSWNYDCQFEIAYSEYYERDLNKIWSKLNVNNKTTFGSVGNNSVFSLIKLNGSALIYNSSNNASLNRLFDPHFGRQGMSEINYVGTAYFDSSESQNTENALSFAWENINNSFIEEIKKQVKEARILVIIGYSFPYFNRGIDKQIIGEMTQLKKVYIQDPNASEVKEIFEATLSKSQTYTLEIEYILKKGVKQFVIPNEM